MPADGTIGLVGTLEGDGIDRLTQASMEACYSALDAVVCQVQADGRLGYASAARSCRAVAGTITDLALTSIDQRILTA